MPFGIQCGAYWCARLFKPWMAGLQRRGHTATIYADDVLILGESPEAVNRALNDAISLATELGITLKFNKSNLTPTSTIQYLGMLIDLSTRTHFKVPVFVIQE